MTQHHLPGTSPIEDTAQPLSAVVLAGGRGRRLGGDKATIELGGETLLQRAVRLVSHSSDDVMAVVRAQQRQRLQVEAQVGQTCNGVRIVFDAQPYVGVLAGIASGLAAARHDWCLVVACDMPFINLDLLQHMTTLRQGYDAVVPRLEVGLEPLLSLYHKRCLPALWRTLDAGERRVVSFYQSLRVRYIGADEIRRFDPEGRSFHNINSPEDLARAREWLRITLQEQRQPGAEGAEKTLVERRLVLTSPPSPLRRRRGE